jgi:hypothetical protein
MDSTSPVQAIGVAMLAAGASAAAAVAYMKVTAFLGAVYRGVRYAMASFAVSRWSPDGNFINFDLSQPIPAQAPDADHPQWWCNAAAINGVLVDFHRSMLVLQMQSSALPGGLRRILRPDPMWTDESGMSTMALVFKSPTCVTTAVAAIGAASNPGWKWWQYGSLPSTDPQISMEFNRIIRSKPSTTKTPTIMLTINKAIVDHLIRSTGGGGGGIGGGAAVASYVGGSGGGVGDTVGDGSTDGIIAPAAGAAAGIVGGRGGGAAGGGSGISRPRVVVTSQLSSTEPEPVPMAEVPQTRDAPRIVAAAAAASEDAGASGDVGSTRAAGLPAPAEDSDWVAAFIADVLAGGKGFRKPRGGPPYVNVPAPSRPHHHAIEQAE